MLQAATPDAILLLFIDDDRLSYLELASTDPDLHFAEFPDVELVDFSASESD